MTFKKISGWLTLAAITSLFFRRGIFHPFILQPFEVLIFTAVFFGLVAIVRNGIKYEEKILLIYWLKRISLLLGLFALGFFYSFLSFSPNIKVLSDLLRDYFLLFSCASAFFLILYHGSQLRFIKSSLKSFLINLSFAIFLIVPSLIFFINVTEGYGGLFLGFHDSRTAFGNFLLIPFAVMLALFIKNRKMSFKISAWIGTTALTALILWTSARGAYFTIILITLFVYFITTSRKKLLPRAFLFLSVGIISVAIAYIFLPQRARNTVLLRVFPQYSYLQNLSSFSQEELTRIGITPDTITATRKSTTLFNTDGLVMVPIVRDGDLLKFILKNPRPELNTSSRISIWSQALPLFLQNPFGLSTQFYNTSKKIDDEAVSSHLAGSHNTFLQIGLSGGWIALLLFLGYIFKIYKSLKDTRDESWEWLALAAANFGIFITLLFDDRLFDPWAWVITSLAIAYAYTRAGVIAEVSAPKTF